MWEGLVAREPMLAEADQRRWSAQQKQALDMGGVIGSFVLDMTGRAALFPYLWLGQWVHAGKGAVMGMGAIRVRPE
jgi:CRISPR/Cas system endoribonuclease Cas6 (RAMP superfamily)